MEYKLASFTNRFAALIIDGILIHVAAKFLTFPFGFGFNPWNVFNGNFLDFAEYSGYVGVVALVYYVFMESSSRSATIGKQVMHIKVLDENGDNLTLSKSIIRNFVKVLCGNIFMLGFFFALFTKNKQALHDILGTTLVVEDRPVAADSPS
ncbi:MAG TPA: RDD family protein [Saprospiraceae bacterium]|nr:RDD family protein [Saprospiraceae bacterium]WKZ62331.1 MAG: RDD family protein [Saprospiraceae bacterium]HRN33139.1 RDD family protein [Saprospiraceae bacterium]HRP83793.1 RDD family protein [Saprospiraceae bacterium]